MVGRARTCGAHLVIAPQLAVPSAPGRFARLSDECLHAFRFGIKPTAACPVENPAPPAGYDNRIWRWRARGCRLRFLFSSAWLNSIIDVEPDFESRLRQFEGALGVFQQLLRQSQPLEGIVEVEFGNLHVMRHGVLLVAHGSFGDARARRLTSAFCAGPRKGPPLKSGIFKFTPAAA